MMQKRDPQIQSAKVCVMQLFEDKIKRAKRKPYYLTQIQTLHEETFSDNVIYQALTQLEAEGKLRRKIVPTQTQSQMVCFYFHSEFDNIDCHPLLNTHMKSTCKLIDKYSNPIFCKAYGDHLEQLVRQELRKQGFKIVGKHTSEYRNKKWTKTDNTLDIIAEHQSGKLTIGVEVKNTISILDKSEVETKLDICDFLGITPVFATRWLKPHEQLINQRRGFSWTFKQQLYPPCFKKLTIKVNKRLHMPTQARADLPTESIQCFHRWVKSKISEKLFTTASLIEIGSHKAN